MRLVVVGLSLDSHRSNSVYSTDVFGNHDAKRLYDDLMRKSSYNKLIRPVGNSTAKLIVKLCLKLSQLIDVVSINLLIATD